MKRIIPAVAALAIVGLALTGCSAGSSGGSVQTADNGDLVIDGEVVATADVYKAAKDEGSLVFYTGGSETSEQQVADAFTDATGIDVEIVRLAPNKLQERILSELSAGQLGADLIRISGEDLIAQLADQKAFQKTELSPDISKALIPEAIYDDGLYFNSFDRVYSFAYNNQVVSSDTAPKNWADLIKPEYAGKLGIVQVGAGGSTAALTRFQLDTLGQDWLESYAAAKPRIFDSSASLTDALSRGEIGIGPVPIATAYSAVLDGAPLTIATPEEGAAAYPFYLGETSSTKRPNASTVFINWLLSSAGQELAASIGDYPVHTGLPNPTIGDIGLPAADDGFVHRATLQESLDNLQPDASLWSQIFGYTG
ncbi:ABC transporter substrate-binding protein [Subtercola sp. RTI3]|uniref:ABC transporter substrate-binding protein n=1 Tax=Subtercola sp. RTI3 TaxID=3048639 RepID=UPI002B23E16B|nr:extracellular solute-binding protein [Subtercola sp. RTI3]MEA9984253.1 extracellular solute-binding protein [Subtercola sp. RTI3]